MENVAYIGLGIMGRPMALNLLRAGFSVRGWGGGAGSNGAPPFSYPGVCQDGLLCPAANE